LVFWLTGVIRLFPMDYQLQSILADHYNLCTPFNSAVFGSGVPEFAFNSYNTFRG